MKRPPLQLPVTRTLLSVFCATLAAAVWLQLSTEPAAVATAAPPPATADAPAAASPAPPVAMPPRAAYGEIAERPLFLPSRRPPAVELATPTAPMPAVPPPPPASALRSYSLVGIAIAGGDRVAVLKTSSSPAPVRISEGAKLNGWTAAAIAEDRVLFRSGANEYVMEIPKPQITSPQPGGPNSPAPPVLSRPPVTR